MKAFTSIFGISILLCIILSGCKKDSKDATKINYLKVNGTEYEISKGFLMSYIDYGFVCNIEMNLLSSGITIHEKLGEPDSASGIGNIIYFDIYSSSSDKLAKGSYTLNNSRQPGSFEYSEYVLNCDIGQNPYPDYTELKSGFLNVLRNGEEYELTFTGMDQNNNSISGYYKGSLKFYAYSGDKKSLGINDDRNSKLKFPEE
jgi:hypothetical protein